jgi:capsular polysaccharide biosynthesis protein
LVVGAHGAGLTNLLFARGAGVVELHPTRSIYPHYYLLCGALGHSYRYLCGDGMNRNSNFTVDVPALERLVDELEASTSTCGHD